MNWRTLQGKQIEIPLEEEVSRILEKEKMKGHELRVCIGTDSEVYGASILYASVIVFVRAGKGAFMLVSKTREELSRQIKDRMLREVSISIEVAYELNTVFEAYNIPVEVHVDINEDERYPSNVALKEAMGYIKGMGYEFKAKPEAFASTNCADRML